MPRIARFKTMCRACMDPIWPGEPYEGYGQVYDSGKKKAVNAWYHAGCLEGLQRKAEVAARLAMTPVPSGRRSRKTRKGWIR